MDQQDPYAFLRALEAGARLFYCESCGYTSELDICCAAKTEPFGYTADELRAFLAEEDFRDRLRTATLAALGSVVVQA